MKRGSPDALESAVRHVVTSGLCSGCGVCALVSDRISVELDDAGFARPIVMNPSSDTEQSSHDTADLFRKVCPGLVVHARTGGDFHPVFGHYVRAWQGWAVDEETREKGSSGGVITALVTWLLSTGQAASAGACCARSNEPNRTVPVELTTREEALKSAGSRYAPVVGTPVQADVLVGKPCEAVARSQLADAQNLHPSKRPLLVSFFCAGTPTQNATDDLAVELGVSVNELVTLRYRGNGWPGEFFVESRSGTTGSMSYEQSWGKRLGRRLQDRCKLCVDGTGEMSDIAVGDFWSADARGFPLFNDSPGNSVIIARTERGARAVLAAIDGQIIKASPVDLGDVARIQPLQTERRRTIPGRLLGRLAAGKPIPRYRGFSLTRIFLATIGPNMRAAVGMFLRTKGWRG